MILTVWTFSIATDALMVSCCSEGRRLNNYNPIFLKLHVFCRNDASWQALRGPDDWSRNNIFSLAASEKRSAVEDCDYWLTETTISPPPEPW